MNSRLTLAGICLLAAFGLAACGGGGGGPTAATDTGTDTGTDTVATELTEAQLATIRRRAEITAEGIGPGSTRADAFPDAGNLTKVPENAHIIDDNELVAADTDGNAATENDIEQVDPSWYRTDSTGAMWKGELYERGDADTDGETVVRIIRYHDRAAPGEADYSDYYSECQRHCSRSEITGAVDATGVLMIADHYSSQQPRALRWRFRHHGAASDHPGSRQTLRVPPESTKPWWRSTGASTGFPASSTATSAVLS